MTIPEIHAILGDIQYKPSWVLQLGILHGTYGYCTIWWEFQAESLGFLSTVRTLQRGRKWYVDCTMSKTEIVRTAYLAAVQAEVHEAQEWFRYCGAQTQSPHVNIDEVVRLTGT